MTPTSPRDGESVKENHDANNNHQLQEISTNVVHPPEKVAADEEVEGPHEIARGMILDFANAPENREPFANYSFKLRLMRFGHALVRASLASSAARVEELESVVREILVKFGWHGDVPDDDDPESKLTCCEYCSEISNDGTIHKEICPLHKAQKLLERELPKQSGVEPNALADAKWNKLAYEFLVAPSSVAPESGEEKLGDLKRWNAGDIEFDGEQHATYFLSSDVDAILNQRGKRRVLDEYRIAHLESENSLFRAQLAKLKGDFLSQLKRDDQRYENWKKIQKS